LRQHDFLLRFKVNGKLFYIRQQLARFIGLDHVTPQSPNAFGVNFFQALLSHLDFLSRRGGLSRFDTERLYDEKRRT
jgi:hypothetical protein